MNWRDRETNACGKNLKSGDKLCVGRTILGTTQMVDVLWRRRRQGKRLGNSILSFKSEARSMKLFETETTPTAVSSKAIVHSHNVSEEQSQ